MEKRREDIPLDVLAERYATPEMIALWSPENKIRLERRLWIAIMRAQRELGVNIPAEVITAYEAAVDKIDLEWIAAREAETKHDVKARIDAFNFVTEGQPEHTHRGLTSRDLTDCVEQMINLSSMKLLRTRIAATLAHLRVPAEEEKKRPIAARTHNVAAQTTSFGHRFAQWAEELLTAFSPLDHFIEEYALRGIKGPVGTQQDMIALLRSVEKALEFEKLIAQHLGFNVVFDAVGQVYPRSLDYQQTGILVQLASGCGNMAKTIRLMAGHELVHEGFKEGQTGSSGMPHKINSRSCERVNSLTGVLHGFHAMTSYLIGDQWNEGDVSCSVIRRVALPGSAYALDGLLEATMTVLQDMQVFPGMMEREQVHYAPYVNSTHILLALVVGGMGREQAHALIKKHSVAAINEQRQDPNAPDFVSRLMAEPDCWLTERELREICKRVDYGAAEMQTDRVCRRIDELLSRFPEAKLYKPQPIL